MKLVSSDGICISNGSDEGNAALERYEKGLRGRIKQDARMLEDIEELESMVKDGFWNYDDTPYRSFRPDNKIRFELLSNFFFGCNIDGSVNQRMSAAVKKGHAAFDKVLRDEAEKIISEYWKGAK